MFNITALKADVSQKMCIFTENEFFIMRFFGFLIELKSFKIPLSPLEFRKQQKDTFSSKDYLNKYLSSGHKVPKYHRIYQSNMYKLYIIATDGPRTAEVS